MTVRNGPHILKTRTGPIRQPLSLKKRLILIVNTEMIRVKRQHFIQAFIMFYYVLSVGEMKNNVVN